MSTPTLSFIGAGNMARAIIGGLLASGHPANKIWVSAPEDSHLQTMGRDFGVFYTTDNRYCAEQGDIVVMAVKPQIMARVCQDVVSVVQNTRPLVVSIAAGLDTATLGQWLGGGVPLVRCMPNTPSLVGQGASALFATAEVNNRQKQQVTQLFDGIGMTLWLEDEDQMHAVTGLSGSGPAYFFLMLEALEEAAVEAGLPAASARRLAIQTMGGAARMAAESDDDPGQLKRNVMSPGGTTEQAVQTFETGNLRQLVKQAHKAAMDRSRAMQKELSQP
ncbi:MAG: pyrroline-5-carboxylate reductase [Halomonadaceae bacterium]|nr:MAG: pyrroline-5-carboxylate reductase [Halomonadaceae bacterium]